MNFSSLVSSYNPQPYLPYLLNNKTCLEAEPATLLVLSKAWFPYSIASFTVPVQSQCSPSAVPVDCVYCCLFPYRKRAVVDGCVGQTTPLIFDAGGKTLQFAMKNSQVQHVKSLSRMICEVIDIPQQSCSFAQLSSARL